ncbi:MAG: hypothetical protein IH881_14200 [Myxococcales bacterium]|nr:hypothetical protein [Myxococcales bacterium]
MIETTNKSRNGSKASKIRWMGAIAAIAFLFATGCGDSYEPVAASECSKLVRHARKLLGNRADSHSETLTKCKAATDQERGCAMVADSAADLMRCSM